MPQERENVFGKLIRSARVDAGLSLRQTAQHLGISHVFLSEVERGVRAPLKRTYWAKLMEIMPTLTHDALDRAVAIDRPVKISVATAPRNYQDLTLAFARRVENQDLKDDVIEKMFELLDGNKTKE